MRKSVFLLFAMIITTAAVMAQSDDNPPPSNHPAASARPHQSVEQRAKDATDKTNATAQLSADQYAKVLEVNKNFFAQREALRANAAQSPDNEDARTKMRDLAKDRESKLKAILTPDQWQKVQAARPQPHQGGHPGGE